MLTRCMFASMDHEPIAIGQCHVVFADGYRCMNPSTRGRIFCAPHEDSILREEAAHCGRSKIAGEGSTIPGWCRACGMRVALPAHFVIPVREDEPKGELAWQAALGAALVPIKLACPFCTNPLFRERPERVSGVKVRGILP